MEKTAFAELMLQLMGKIRSYTVRNNIAFARQNNLSMSQLGTLFRLKGGGPSSVSEISVELGVSSAAASQFLERLVQQGLVQRSESPQDRRARIIVLTDKGRRLVENIHLSGPPWLHDAIDNLSTEETQQAADAIKVLLDFMDKAEQNYEEMRKP